MAELSRALLEHPTEPFDFLWLRTMVQGRASPLGDVPLFDMFTLHGSCDNHMGGGRVRLSCDVRWQRAGAPRDDRWFGAPPPGHGCLGYGGLNGARPPGEACAARWKPSASLLEGHHRLVAQRAQQRQTLLVELQAHLCTHIGIDQPDRLALHVQRQQEKGGGVD